MRQVQPSYHTPDLTAPPDLDGDETGRGLNNIFMTKKLKFMKQIVMMCRVYI